MKEELNLNDLDAELGTEPEEGVSQADEIASILNFMDALGGTKEDRRRANVARSKKQVEEWNKPAPFVAVTWYPDALSLRVRRQVCRCGATHSHTEGIFLRQITKNGAQKWTQASREELEKFRGLERVQDVVEEEIPHCVSCWN